MIALDTNVLARLLVKDDEDQHQKVVKMLQRGIGRGTTYFIPDVVVVELVWVLGSRYRYNRDEIGMALKAMFEAKHLEFESIDRCRRALQRFRSSKGGFADYMIVECARDQGCTFTATFDKALLESDDFEEPS